MTQATTRVSALLPENFVDELKKFAKENNVSLNYLFKTAIQKWFDERLKEDAKSLAEMDFLDLPGEDTWNNVQSKW